MITRILYFIKHHLSWIWKFIEEINGWIFNGLYADKIERIIQEVLTKHDRQDGFNFRVISDSDLKGLRALLLQQDEEQLKYFKPHEFDLNTLIRLHRNRSFIMMGVWNRGHILVGYFFLRFFINKKVFIGRLVDKTHQRKGLAKSMSSIMYEIAARSGFVCMTTISKDNFPIMKLHQKEGGMEIIRELEHNYVLVAIHPPVNK